LAEEDAKISVQYVPKDLNKTNDEENNYQVILSKSSSSEGWSVIHGTFSVKEDLTPYSAIYLVLESSLPRALFNKVMLTEGGSKKEWSPAPGENLELNELAKTFSYLIKDVYNPLFNNNSVFLKIIDKNGHEYWTNKSFSFSSYGTSGTDYTLIIEEPMEKATLYGADN
jgi:hypothetical protein